jgi:hypothetical protein
MFFSFAFSIATSLISLQVVLKFLAKIAVDTETVLDGVQCTEAVFSKEPGHYSIILVRLIHPFTFDGC